MGAEKLHRSRNLKNSDLHTRPILGQKIHQPVVLRKCHFLRKPTGFFPF
jgi:hypothetical protein